MEMWYKRVCITHMPVTTTGTSRTVLVTGTGTAVSWVKKVCKAGSCNFLTETAYFRQNSDREM